MASTNQSPFYQRAEEEFHKANNDRDRIACLEIMIKECPKHKSSENMLKNLTLRLKKLKGNVVKQKKAGKSGAQGIKKAEVQVVLSGFTNAGKTTIFNLLTGLDSKVSVHPFTTHKSRLGVFRYEGALVQVVDTMSFPNHDKSLVNSTDTLGIVVDDFSQIENSEEYTYRSNAKKIFIFNKIDLLNPFEIRKLEAKLKSKYRKLDFIFFSEKTGKTGLEELKEKIFGSFSIIRIYTKEPKKTASEEAMLLKEGSTFKVAVEKILKGMSLKIKKARVWGPSSKFGGQIIGLSHILKDKDIIEFQTK
ncbi:MAG: 50S ribosome-binding GTPase [Nanoarchaeota archaeon]|nr:50S ribosome-binding GTPase [Nanoarchaeota archaeon]